MPRLGKKVIRAGLETLYHTRSHRIARPFLAGVGAILTFHRVRPSRPDEFQPNRSLEITPQFLEDVVAGLRDADIDLISLDEVRRRLIEGDFSRRFVALTFDDGYRDNAEYAWPILKRHGAPATLFVASSFAEGRGVLWWVELERAIAECSEIEMLLGGTPRRFDCATVAAKKDSFEEIYWSLRALPDEAELRRACRDLAQIAGVDIRPICKELCMGWSELRDFARDPLITVGGHTDAHTMLRKSSEPAVRQEMLVGARRIEQALGARPTHFAFPLGDPAAAGPREFAIAADLGFETAVTARPGVLFPEHRDHLTALPRISVNGEFQRMRYLDVLLSGAPTALINRFRRVDAA